jgi:hypothetical protein
MSTSGSPVTGLHRQAVGSYYTPCGRFRIVDTSQALRRNPHSFYPPRAGRPRWELHDADSHPGALAALSLEHACFDTLTEARQALAAHAALARA